MHSMSFCFFFFILNFSNFVHFVSIDISLHINVSNKKHIALHIQSQMNRKRKKWEETVGCFCCFHQPAQRCISLLLQRLFSNISQAMLIKSREKKNNNKEKSVSNNMKKMYNIYIFVETETEKEEEKKTTFANAICISIPNGTSNANVISVKVSFFVCIILLDLFHRMNGIYV